MLKISESVQKQIEKYSGEVYAGVGPGKKGYEDFLSASLSDANAQTQIKWLEDNLSLNKEQAVLDYGAGSGFLTVSANLLGYNFSGFEIDGRLPEIGRTLCEDNGVDPKKITYNPDGLLPYGDNTFDIISSFFVYEHVADTVKYLEQGLRVLKKGGKFVIFTCNYQLMYEFHYGLFLPLFSKPLTKFILKILGRNATFVDGVNVVTPGRFYRDTKEIVTDNAHIDNVGRREFIPNLYNREQHGELFIKTASILEKAGLLGLAVGSGFYNPLIFVVSKK